jgi:hypothetical protein
METKMASDQAEMPLSLHELFEEQIRKAHVDQVFSYTHTPMEDKTILAILLKEPWVAELTIQEVKGKLVVLLEWVTQNEGYTGHIPYQSIEMRTVEEVMQAARYISFLITAKRYKLLQPSPQADTK